MGTCEAKDDIPYHTRTKYAAVKQEDGNLGCGDAGDVNDHKCERRLVELGELLVSHNPEMLSTTPGDADEAAHGRPNSNDLVGVSALPVKAHKSVIVGYCVSPYSCE
jgi:hypothetical protein